MCLWNIQIGFSILIIDDILIYSKSGEEHVISSVGIVVDPSKAYFVLQWET